MTSAYDLIQKKRLPTLSKVLSALSLVVALGWSGAEALATERPGDLGILDVPSNTFLYNNVDAGTDPFTDVYSFEVASDASFGSRLISVTFQELYNIDKFTTSLWHGTNELAIGTVQIVTSEYATGFVSTLSFSPLKTDLEYELHVGGISTGDKGGYYAGNIALGPHVTPVPEPAIYAMLLTGLGIIGWVARKKKRQVVA